jgi:uroporphyrin-III C-methyltransferase
VIGSGPLAEEKVRGLVEAGAAVRLAARYEPGDLDGVALAIVCSRPAAEVDAVWTEARRRNVLVNTVDDVAHCDFIAPSILRRGDLAIAISTGGKAPALAVRLRQKLEGEIGEEYARFLTLAGSVRAALAARYPDFEERRERWYRLVDSDVLERLRVGDEAGAEERFREILGVEVAQEALTPGPSPSSPQPSPGEGRKEEARRSTAGLGFLSPLSRRGVEGAGRGAGGEGAVYLVGAGPGDPDLMTVRGLRCLREADAIVYDRLIGDAILEEARPGAERIYVGKTPGESCRRQEDINALLISLAREGKTVVRLKGGDPFVFGRGAEEALACRAAGIACEVVPGVSSAVSVPALAGIPVTHRGVASGFAVVTGHCLGEDRVDWAALATVDTLVVLMGMARLPEIAGLLRQHRPATTPAAVLSRGTLPDERVVVGTLEDIAELAAGLAAPATLVVGEVVGLRAALGPMLSRACHDPATISSCLS